MKVELKFITPDPEAHIGEAAAECYDSNTEREACLRRAEHFRHAWAKLQADAEDLYLYAVDQKLMKKEDARYILPQGCTTSLRICGNFQMWHDLLGNRAAKAAQWEVRDVAREILRQLYQHAPRVFPQGADHASD